MLTWVRGLLIALVSASLFIVWLPFNRSWMDGESYAWGLPILGQAMSGRGLGGDYWVLPPLVLFGAITLLAGWRASRRMAGMLSGLWFLVWLASLLVFRVSEGPVFFQGDTLAITLDITAIAAGVILVGVTGAWLLVRAPEKENDALAWAPLNTTFTVFFLGIWAAAFALLASGEPDGQTDRIGVVTLIAMPVLANLALMPWRRT